jgi:glutaredoxin-like protein
MGFFQDKDKPLIKERLSAMRSEVTLSYFTQEIECEFCRATRELLEELCTLHEKMKLRVFDFKDNRTEVEKYAIDKIPATVIADGNDYGIRFYGVPAGYEFSSLLEAILMVSRGESSLSAESKKALQEIGTPVHLQVLVTPT